jgi:hypothetical protein
MDAGLKWQPEDSLARVTVTPRNLEQLKTPEYSQLSLIDRPRAHYQNHVRTYDVQSVLVGEASHTLNLVGPWRGALVENSEDAGSVHLVAVVWCSSGDEIIL